MAKQGMNGQVDRRRERLRQQYLKPLRLIGTSKLKSLVSPDVFSVPHKRSSARAVADAALRMADALERYPDVLVEAGLPDDFLTTMRREAHDLALAPRRSATARNRRSVATRDLKAELERINEAMSVINALVMIHFRNDRSQMQFWQRLLRVRKRQGRPRRRKDRGGNQKPA
jgi:hypothetical protein